MLRLYPLARRSIGAGTEASNRFLLAHPFSFTKENGCVPAGQPGTLPAARRRRKFSKQNPLNGGISLGKSYQMVGFFRVIVMYFQRIGDLRSDHDLRQKDIAALLNLNTEVYRRYEKGEREIPVWALIKLADYYHTSTDYLLGRTNDPTPPHA